jgi:uridine phosphorylase
LALADADMNQKLETFRFGSQKVTNFEMETSALYGLSKMLGHNAVTICAIIANRYKKEYSKDYKKTVVKMVELVLERIVEK